jgi:hypothetical protein
MRSRKNYPILKWIFIPLIIVLLTAGFYFTYQIFQGSSARTSTLISWIRYPSSNPDWSMEALTRCNPSSPFIFPTEGYIGFLWDDSFRPGHHHQGIDIFSGKESGVTPVYAVHDGYLTRLPEWKSTLIIRIPEDPLIPERQIWVYFTHLADINGNSYIVKDFPPGTFDMFIEQGTLLGYQGNYSGTPNNPVGVHLHLSIVKDNGEGGFLNELKIQNTIDPSPYFDLPLNGNINKDEIPLCSPSHSD